MVAAGLRQTKLTILLSLNAAAILIAGVLIAGAILLNGGMDFKVVGERSDDVEDTIEAPELIDAESNSATTLTDSQRAYVTSVHTVNGVDSTPVPEGELWGEEAITMFETANFDICGGNLPNICYAFIFIFPFVMVGE